MTPINFHRHPIGTTDRHPGSPHHSRRRPTALPDPRARTPSRAHTCDKDGGHDRRAEGTVPHRENHTGAGREARAGPHRKTHPGARGKTLSGSRAGLQTRFPPAQEPRLEPLVGSSTRVRKSWQEDRDSEPGETSRLSTTEARIKVVLLTEGARGGESGNNNINCLTRRE